MSKVEVSNYYFRNSSIQWKQCGISERSSRSINCAVVIDLLKKITRYVISRRPTKIHSRGLDSLCPWTTIPNFSVQMGLPIGLPCTSWRGIKTGRTGPWRLGSPTGSVTRGEATFKRMDHIQWELHCSMLAPSLSSQSILRKLSLLHLEATCRRTCALMRVMQAKSTLKVLTEGFGVKTVLSLYTSVGNCM